MAFIELSEASWDDFFPDSCTIEAASQTTNELLEMVEGWAPVAGLEDIGAQVEFKGGKPVTRDGKNVGVSSHEIGLRGYFPAINESQRARVGADIYRILAAGSDSQHVKTRLLVEKVS